MCLFSINMTITEKCDIGNVKMDHSSFDENHENNKGNVTYRYQVLLTKHVQTELQAYNCNIRLQLGHKRYELLYTIYQLKGNVFLKVLTRRFMSMSPAKVADKLLLIAM